MFNNLLNFFYLQLVDGEDQNVKNFLYQQHQVLTLTTAIINKL